MAVLLGPDGSVRKGLRKVDHYRGVNEQVWNIFQEYHGGDTLIFLVVVALLCLTPLGLRLYRGCLQVDLRFGEERSICMRQMWT